MRRPSPLILAIAFAFLVGGLNNLAGPATIGLATSAIDNLSPGQWYEVPGSRLDLSGQVPNPSPPGRTGPAAVMSAWSGGAYDSRRDQLVVTGGGHTDYAGNELYAFDIAALTWRRIWGPTPAGQIQTGSVAYGETYLNGDPRSVHTYAGLVYLPTQDRIWRHGGSLWSDNGSGSQATWTFNLTTGTWERKSDLSGFNLPIAAYDPVTGHVFLHKYAYLWEYDPATDTFTQRSTQGPGYDPVASAAIDQRTRQFVFVGDGQVFSYQLDRYPTTLVARPTTGATEVLTNHVKRPGLTWDSVAQQLVAWNGGTAAYTLDTTTWVWGRHAPASTNTVMPSAPSGGGTLGRWQYLSKHNAYVLVNAISGSVYFYRLGDSVSTEPAPSLVPPQNLRLLGIAQQSDPVPPPVSPSTLTIQAGQWTAVPLPADAGKGGIPGTVKHVSPGYNPSDGRLYFTAGDYPSNFGLESYRQETWSLSVKDRLADPTNPAAGWRLEYPYCGSGPLQPKWPDFGGFHWDSTRQRFWWVAGVTEISSPACTGETADKVDNPGFSFGRVMTYDPANKLWANVGPAGPAFTKNEDTIYDSVTDALITLREGTSTGDVLVDTFSMKAGAWSSKHVFASPATSQTLYGFQGYAAFDAAARSVYYIELNFAHLMRYAIDTGALADLGPVPSVAAMAPGWQPKVVWDSTHKILYWHNHAAGEFFGYHPDTKLWERLSTASNLSGIQACNANVMVYDPGNDVLLAWGDVWGEPGTCNSNARPYVFLYRYPG
jgi:hypothetical protein